MRPKMLDELLTFYGVTGEAERREMHQLAVGGRERGRWSKFASVLSKQYSTYAGYENDATDLQIYETLVVHGLLQTPAHAEAVVRASRPGEPSATIRKLVDVRLKRQRRLRGDDPLRLMVVMDEAVLHRIIGGDVQVHLDQMAHLLDVARTTPHVRVQVIPFDHAMFPGMVSSFTIMNFPHDPDIVYIETLTGDRYEDAPEADSYKVAFGDLRAAALSEPASIELIEAAVDRAASTLKGHPMPMDARWRKSTRSGGSGSCVEVRLVDGTVQVRDTKLGEDSPILDFDARQWAVFTADIRDHA